MAMERGPLHRPHAPQKHHTRRSCGAMTLVPPLPCPPCVALVDDDDNVNYDIPYSYRSRLASPHPHTKKKKKNVVVVKRDKPPDMVHAEDAQANQRR